MKDMAICFVYFNPASSKRLLMNYLYVKNHYLTRRLPVYTIELVYKGREREISDSIIVRSDSIMFHKENLIRILEKKLPSCYTKLACIDADIIFSDDEWYERTSELLNNHDVVQPFSECVWWDLTYTKELIKRQSIVLLPTKKIYWKYHTGFAYCFRRDWYNKIGFYDYCVIGGGDVLGVMGWMKLDLANTYNVLSKCMKTTFMEFYNKPSPRLTYLENNIAYHLFHGARKDRQYENRHLLLSDEDEITNIIKINRDGVYEWTDKYKAKLNELFYNYFVSRKDDNISD
jgi:hypothetical protein